ncbi:hypothetical protein H0H93_009896 [Arthromyces matolae]|nr:hypothetical protein H0H93_009896 [Arthromyces matolae]
MDTLAHPEPGSTWRETVLKKTGIHHQWLGDLELSIAGDFNAKRVGGIMQRPSQLATLLPSLSKLSIPLFVSWGDLQDPEVFRAPEYLKAKQFVPTAAQIQILRSGQDLPQELTRSPPPSSQPSRVRFAPVDPLSTQRPEENWVQFFARRQKAHNPQLLNPVQKQQVESRAKNALKQAAPGKKGARVFIWEDVDGFRVRRPAGRRHVDDIWEAYGSKQRRYDAVFDEWDLCSEFGEASDDGSDDEEHIPATDDTDLGTFNEEPAALDSLTELLPDNSFQLPIGREQSMADLQRVHGLDDREEASSFFFSDTAEDRAYFWYGFVTPDHPMETTATDGPTWSISREFLGNGRWLDSMNIPCPTSPPSSATQGYICTFFGRLLSSRKVDDMPAALYDLSTQLVVENSPIRVRRETIEGVQHYFLQLRRSNGLESPSWQVELTSASCVLQIMRRQWGPDLVTLVRELLDRGIRFRTPIEGSVFILAWVIVPKTICCLPVSPRSLPAQPKRPSCTTDYAAYLSHRDRFLRSPRGRAALMHGGIVSRLAREAVQYQHVYDGPTFDVFSTGAMLPGSSVGYWDDALTDHEINVICGVYKVDTGEF